jgi:hypothetical protein
VTSGSLTDSRLNAERGAMSTTSTRSVSLGELKVNIVGWGNRGGLRQDAAIIEALLRSAGADVSVSSWYLSGTTRITRNLETISKRRWRRRFDLSIFLERAPPYLLGQARRNWLIPNPEWLVLSPRVAARIDLILAKSRNGAEVLGHLGRPLVYSGFTSWDRRDLKVDRRSEGALHIAGRSWQKGTAALVAAWERHPEWPSLTVLHRPQEHGGTPLRTRASNITYVSDYLSEEEVHRLQNEFTIHLCPSEVEGFGHTINEGLSVGALVLTTDGPPMNELVQEGRGVLVPWDRQEPMLYGTRYLVAPAAVEAAVGRMLTMSSDERVDMSRRARAWFEQSREEFADRLLAITQDHLP